MRFDCDNNFSFFLSLLCVVCGKEGLGGEHNFLFFFGYSNFYFIFSLSKIKSDFSMVFEVGW